MNIHLNKSVVSYDDIIDALTKLQEETGTKTNTYVNNWKTIHRIFKNPSNYRTFLNQYNKVIELIETATDKNQREYSINSKKAYFQAIVFTIDRFEIPVTKKARENYVLKFSAYKNKSVSQNETKQNEKETIPFTQYLQMVKDKFGENSKMYVLMRLYQELPIRDNFRRLKIVSSMDDVVIPDNNEIEKEGESDNFIVMKRGNRAKKIWIVITNYKTAKKYGVIKHGLTVDTSRLVKKYINENQLNYGDYLFGSAPLSPFISLQNQKLGMDLGSVNEIRHRIIAEALANKNLSDDEKVKLSQKMKHSINVQRTYNRKKLKLPNNEDNIISG